MKTLAHCALFVLCGCMMSAATYTVGPNRQYKELDEVPWQSLLPGDTVAIYWRAAPYKGKFVLCRVGTRTMPIVVRGIPNPSGDLPVIDGDDATTSTALNFWNEARGIIKIGGANQPPDTTPEYIRIEDLEIRSGRPGYFFTGRDGRQAQCFLLDAGQHLVVLQRVVTV